MKCSSVIVLSLPFRQLANFYTLITMTDYKQLCAELVKAWDDLPWHYDWKGNLIGLADGCQLDDSAVERARAALAEPEPEGPTDEELDELFVHVDQSGEPESWRTYARAVLAHWGK